jgi:hypothetical protein
MQLFHTSPASAIHLCFCFALSCRCLFEQSLAALQQFLDFFAAANTAVLTEKFDSGALNSTQTFTAFLQHQRLFPRTLFFFRFQSSVYKSLWQKPAPPISRNSPAATLASGQQKHQRTLPAQ